MPVKGKQEQELQLNWVFGSTVFHDEDIEQTYF